MLPLYEMMMQAQNGEAMRVMARQFGLDEDQAARAMEALMPAFSTGLKRNATNPYTMFDFWQAFADPGHTQYFENLSKAFTPKGVDEGNHILGQLFGSKEISRAVAYQAAQFSGLSQEILKQMMPVIAASMMGGLYKQASNAFGANSAQGVNAFADMMEQMTGVRQNSKPKEFEYPFAAMMEQMFGSGTRKPEKKPAADNPFMKMFEGMMAASMPSSKPEPEPEPEKSANPYDKLFGNMFEAGIEIQKDYQKNMESIFDTYVSGSRKQ